MRKRRKKGKLLIGTGILLIVAGLMIAGYNLYDSFRAEHAASGIVEQLEAAIIPAATPQPIANQEYLLQETVEDDATKDHAAMDIPEMPVAVDMPSEVEIPDYILDPNMEMPVAVDMPSEVEIPDYILDPNMEMPVAVDVPSEVEIPDYILNPNMEMPVSRQNGQDYIGILEIPALDLKLPVISEWSYPRLRIAPCRYSGSAYKNNLVISAHNYASHFGFLKNLDGGERVIFTDADGNRFDYRVELRETLGPKDIDYMVDSEWDLTLFTCTTGGSYRIAVRSVIIRN